MIREAVYHKQYSEYAYPLNENTLVIRIRARKNEMVTCIVFYEEKYDSSIKGKVVMEKAASDELFDYFEARLCVGIKRFKYMFYMEDAYEALWYNQNGFHKHRPNWGHFSFSYICGRDIVKSVDWFEGNVIYQIFPDRFKKLDTSDNTCNGFYGGNITGLISEFEYIKDLGIGCIYLNPIFKSNSYHRYDINDYYEVDRVFGDKVQLKEFIDLCHASSIKVIFDAVLNHTGSGFFAFKDVMVNGPKSAYKDWFYINSFPVSGFSKPNYECFSFFGGMPKLNTANPKVIEYMVNVLGYWICEFDIDGFRFDVADEIDRDFWRQIRKELKAVKSDIVLIGEIFDEASSWLNGDQFDSVINYPLKALVNDLFAYRSISVELFRQRVSGYFMNYRSGVLNSMVNVLSTHDTPRFLTLCKECEKRFILAVVFQFTFPGVPLVYYGDEIGMKGGDDPDCRKPMVWDKSKWNKKLLNLYGFLTKLRKEHKALGKGSFIDLIVNADSGVLAYGRQTKDELMVVIINTTNSIANISVNIGNFGRDFSCAYDLFNKSNVEIEKNLIEDSLKPYEWKILSLDENW